MLSLFPGFHEAREGDYESATDVVGYGMQSHVFPLTALHTEMCERSTVVKEIDESAAWWTSRPLSQVTSVRKD